MDIDKKDRSYPEILLEFADNAAETLISEGMSEEKAIEIGLKIATKIRKDFGGEVVYIPKGRCYELSLRDSTMLAEYNGNNATDIFRKYGITRRRLLQILQAKREGRVYQMTFDLEGGQS
ncbi:MAG: hypothetical protein HQM08_17290 [Candidatus Riflebacteria bacterium]|nr:hypothetical protein [Candidatus Riflebacteria bacterium]